MGSRICLPECFNSETNKLIVMKSDIRGPHWELSYKVCLGLYLYNVMHNLHEAHIIIYQLIPEKLIIQKMVMTKNRDLINIRTFY